MGPKHVHVDEDDANNYASEDVVVVPRQSATTQTVNMLGRSGQSSLKRGKAGLEGAGHLQEGEWEGFGAGNQRSLRGRRGGLRTRI